MKPKRANEPPMSKDENRLGNPKSESRNPKQIQMRKEEKARNSAALVLKIFHLMIRVCFGFRISDFGFEYAHPWFLPLQLPDLR